MVLANVAGLASAQPEGTAATGALREICAQEPPKATVKAMRFPEGPPAFSFMVTNHGTLPIRMISIGSNGDRSVLAIAPETEPTSLGSPKGWKGTRTFGYETPFLKYFWEAEDPNARIQPGESLTGFSVQLPEPQREDPRDTRGQPVLTDLTAVPFRAVPYRCPGWVQEAALGASQADVDDDAP
ncbi:MAG: hypothetical protein F4Y01_02545 [Gammaproteobacteria bacterium]|nr:hypothetical protein [Gammaproteobacteria bacterium]